MNELRVVVSSARLGLAELRTTYSLRSWLAEWLVRTVFQVLFFTLLGSFAGSREQAEFILLGNIVAVIALETTLVNTTAAADRYQGTFAFLVAAPADMGVVYLGRGLQWVVTGVASCVLVFSVTPLLISVSWPWWYVLPIAPLLVVIGLSSYFFCCLVASVAFRHPKFRAFFTSIGFLVLAVCCGVNVPVSSLPVPVELLAEVLPLTHGLNAIRAGVAGGGVEVAAQACLELIVAAGWFALTRLTFQRLAARGRRDGSLSFSS